MPPRFVPGESDGGRHPVGTQQVFAEWIITFSRDLTTPVCHLLLLLPRNRCGRQHVVIAVPTRSGASRPAQHRPSPRGVSRRQWWAPSGKTQRRGRSDGLPRPLPGRQRELAPWWSLSRIGRSRPPTHGLTLHPGPRCHPSGADTPTFLSFPVFMPMGGLRRQVLVSHTWGTDRRCPMPSLPQHP